MKIHEITALFEGYPQAQAAFIQQSGGDTASVQKTIADFRQLVNRNQIKDTNQKNIDWWATQGWDKFNAFVNQAAAVPSKTQVIRKKIPGQSINLRDDAQWLIVIPIDKEASCFHGRNSSWCTTKVHQNHFESYFYNSEITLIYCFNKATGGMWAIAAHKRTKRMEMFTQQDNSISAGQFTQQTGLDPQQLRNMALGDVHQPVVQTSRDKWKASVLLTKELLSKLPAGTRSAEIEKQLLYNRHGKFCIRYLNKLKSNKQAVIPLEILIAAVNQDGLMIRHIKKPTEAVQIAAVKNSDEAIQYIDNPSEAVKMAAVGSHGSAIQYINNPSEAVQWAAIKTHGSAIQYIKKPTEAVQIAAVSQNGMALQYIENPSEDIQWAAINQDGWAIKYIENPSEDMKMAAVKTPGMTITLIDNPSEAVQIAAVKNSNVALSYIDNPSEDVQMASVEKWGRSILYIDNPSEAVQIAAVTQDSSAIHCIQNPAPAIKRAAQEQKAREDAAFAASRAA